MSINEDRRNNADTGRSSRDRLSRLTKLLRPMGFSMEEVWAAAAFGRDRTAFGPGLTQEERDDLASKIRRGVEALGSDLDLFDAVVIQDEPIEPENMVRFRAALDRLRGAGYEHPGTAREDSGAAALSA